MKRLKKIKKRLVAFLCIFCAVITIFPVKDTAYAAESVSAEEKEKVEKYIMDTLDVYLCYAGSFGWSQKMFDYGTKRQNDIAIMNCIEKMNSQRVKNRKLLNRFVYLGEGVYKYTNKTKSIIKKERKKLFGKYYKGSKDSCFEFVDFGMQKNNDYSEDLMLWGIKYMFPILQIDNRNAYVIDDVADIGDYITSGKITNIEATDNGYKVKMKYTTNIYYHPKTTTTKREYTVDLVNSGKSFIIKSIEMSDIKGYKKPADIYKTVYPDVFESKKHKLM